MILAMSRRNLPLLGLLAVYFVFAISYAVLTPDWQSPDEPAHYNYVRQLAAGAFPVMEQGDYNSAYQGEVISSRFDPSYSVSEFEYEDYQPPLYYLLLTPAYLLSDGSLTALRLTSVLMGAVTVALAYAIGRKLFPSRPWLALTIAAFVALLPQHLSIISSANNDALAELLVAAMLFVLVSTRADSPSPHLPISMSLLLGLAFLTKVTAYLMAGALGLWLLGHHWGDWRTLWRNGLRLFVPALLIGLLWWGRNVIVYPGLDFLGTQAHDRVVAGQLETSDWVATIGLNEALRLFWQTSFRSFWGQFGWMCCPLPAWTYNPLWLLTIAGAVGFIIWAVRRRMQGRRLGHDRLNAFGFLVGLNVLLFLVYNLSFVQHQGRYLFVSLIPIGIVLSLGWQFWLLPLIKVDRRLGYLLPLGLIVGLVGLNLLVFQQVLPCMTVAGC